MNGPIVVGSDVSFLGQVHRVTAVEPYTHPTIGEPWHIASDAYGWSMTITASIPCGWCDEPVPVVEDHGQVVYCSETHERLNVYTPEAEGNL